MEQNGPFDGKITLSSVSTNNSSMPDFVLKMMWGRFTQFMFTINQDEELLRLVDFWQAVGQGKVPQSNEHYVIGAEYWI